MYESIHVRITKEQYEWLRQYCFENRVAQAEVVREALDMFRNRKEATGLTALRKLTMDCPNSTRFDSKTHFFMGHLDPNWPTFEHELLCTDPRIPGGNYLSLEYRHDSGPYTTTYDKIQAMQERHAIEWLVAQGIIEPVEHESGMTCYVPGPNY